MYVCVTNCVLKIMFEKCYGVCLTDNMAFGFIAAAVVFVFVVVVVVANVGCVCFYDFFFLWACCLFIFFQLCS